MLMADAVEAAARSLQQPTAESIDRLVEGIINKQIDEDQFVNADITLKAITQIKKLFKKKLQSIHHVRVASNIYFDFAVYLFICLFNSSI